MANTAKTVATVLAACTDRFPELVETIPITNDGRRKDVVMSIGPPEDGQMGVPRLLGGDRLLYSAELEVTHDSTIAGAADLVGSAYSYEPVVEAWLLLARSADAVEERPGRAILLGHKKMKAEVKAHHLRIVFAEDSLVIPKKGLPWSGPSHLNLVLSARHKAAKSKNVLLIGQNEAKTATEPARAKGDQGRINIVRFRGQPEAEAKTSHTDERRVKDVPVSKEPVVVYSQALRDLQVGEQLLVRAALPVHNPHSYQARVSVEIVLSNESTGTSLHSPVRDVLTCDGQLAKGNGTNCLPDRDYLTEKYGLARVLRAKKGDAYVNVTVTSSNPVTQSASPGDTIAVRSGGYLEVRRYPTAAAASERD